MSCGAVLELHHHDGSNQLGDLAQGGYSDWTHYAPANRATYAEGRGTSSMAVTDRWRPLVYVDARAT